MNKEEKALVKAIKSKNQAEAVACLKVFTALKNTSDEAANKYFEQIEALDVPVVEEVVEEVVVEEAAPVAEEVVEVVEEVVEAPRVENRGVKAKAKNRKQIDKKFNELYLLSIDYLAETKKLGNAESKFAKRLAKALHVVNKQIFR